MDMEKKELERRVVDLEGIIVSLESKNTVEHAVQVSQFLNHSNVSIAKEKGKSFTPVSNKELTVS